MTKPDALAQCQSDLAEALQHADILAAELAHSLQAVQALQAERQQMHDACWALILDLAEAIDRDPARDWLSTKEAS